MSGGELRDLEHFVDILDTLDAIVWEADASTFEFTYVSDGALHILGYPTERWIANPGFWESLIYPDDRDRTVAFCKSAAQGCRDHHFDYRAIAADGRVLWLHDVVRVVPDDRGTPRLLRGVMTDITERVEAKARLAESEERYRLLAELTSDYAWSVIRGADGEFVFEWVTDAIESVYGRRPDEVVGTLWLDVVHPDDRPASEETQRQLLAGQHIERELRILRPDGDVRWVYAAARRADSQDGKVRIVGSSRDITDRKRAEEELESSERRFRALFDHAPLGVSTVDLDGHPILFNQALVDMLGYPAERLRTMRFVDFSHPDDGEEDLRLYGELQRGERDSYTMEKRYIRADGSVVWGQLIASLIRDDQGEPLCGIGIVQDVSERKEAESERERLQQQLLQSQKMDAVGRLAGGIAHDFNNILSAIVNYAAFIREDPHGPDAVRNDAAEIMSAAERAASLTRQLLVFSRRETPQPVLLDLGEIVTEHSRMLRRMLGEDIGLMLELSPEAPRIVGDRVQMEQVLLNLAVNARDAMPSGGPLTIRVGRHDDGRAQLSVIDAGAGMSADVKARAFEPFFTTKDAARGTGLGLATVYGIVESLGGVIELHSVEGEGTQVDILLPPADGVAVDAPGAGASSEVASASISVLLVEDDDQLRRIIRRMLEREGHTVSVAADASQALRMVAEASEPADIVITDVVMPGMSGVELGRELGRLWPQTAIVYISGYPRDVAEQHGEIDGPLVEKPFTIPALRAGMAEALAR